MKTKKDEIQIQVLNFDNDSVLIWSTKKFFDKLEMMKDVINSYQDTGAVQELDPEEDPFVDPVEPLLLGQVYYKLEPLAYLIDNPSTISIIGQNLQVMGKLECNIIPCDEDESEDIPDELIPEEPEDLIGKRIDFIVEIKQAT